jgi:peptide subunit release factor 1 (eRF1)
VVRDENIEHVVLAGDEVIIPTLTKQLPQHLSDRVIDVVRLDITTPEHEVLQATIASLREQDARNDAEKVERLLDAYRSGGLGVVGMHDTLVALTNHQVDEVVMDAALDKIHVGSEDVGTLLAPDAPVTTASTDDATRTVKVTDELVTQALQSGATVTFIENGDLLADVGGVGALLRYRL